MKTYNIYFFIILLFLNCATDFYSRSFQSNDADQYILMSNEYYPDAQANLKKTIAQNGKSIILESGNLLVPQTETEVRVLSIELRDDLIAKTSDELTTQFKAEKSNVLYFLGFDTPRIYRNSNIVQEDSQGFSDLVEINSKEGEFNSLSENDRIKIQLNKDNYYKLSYETIDLYQIQLDQEVIIFHWKLKKLKSDNYSVVSSQKYTGKAEIQNIHRSRFKYLRNKSFYYLGKTVTIFIDIVTFPFQLPFWIIAMIGVSSGAR